MVQTKTVETALEEIHRLMSLISTTETNLIESLGINRHLYSFCHLIITSPGRIQRAIDHNAIDPSLIPQATALKEDLEKAKNTFSYDCDALFAQVAQKHPYQFEAPDGSFWFMNMNEVARMLGNHPPHPPGQSSPPPSSSPITTITSPPSPPHSRIIKATQRAKTPEQAIALAEARKQSSQSTTEKILTTEELKAFIRKVQGLPP